MSTAELQAFNRNVGRWIAAQDIPANLRNTLRLIAYKASMRDWCHTWSVGKLATYSQSIIAKRLGIRPVSRRTLQRHLTDLEGLGLVKRNRRTRPTDHRHTSNEYVFRFDRVVIGGEVKPFDFATGTVEEPANVAAEPVTFGDDWPVPGDGGYGNGEGDGAGDDTGSYADTLIGGRYASSGHRPYRPSWA